MTWWGWVMVGLALVFVAFAFTLALVHVGSREPSSMPPPPREWIILVRIDEIPTPSETVTAWGAYEAAPQVAVTAAEAVRQFQRDSGLAGPMKAIPSEYYYWRAP